MSCCVPIDCVDLFIFWELIMSEKIAVHTPTKESYDRLMKAYDKKGWRWCDWEKPTEFNDRHHYWEQTAIDMHDKFCKQTIESQKVSWYTIITVEEALAKLWQYERGQEVLVRDTDEDKRQEKIYLATIEWAIYPYICVAWSNNTEYIDWKMFDTTGRKYIKPLEEPIKEMTMQELEEKLGHKVKIVK